MFWGLVFFSNTPFSWCIPWSRLRNILFLHPGRENVLLTTYFSFELKISFLFFLSFQIKHRWVLWIMKKFFERMLRSRGNFFFYFWMTYWILNSFSENSFLQSQSLVWKQCLMTEAFNLKFDSEGVLTSFHFLAINFLTKG